MERWGWPDTETDLRELQEKLAIAGARAEVWRPRSSIAIAGTFFASRTELDGRPPGGPGEPVWAGVAVLREGRVVEEAVVSGVTAASYRPGSLALREGPLLAATVRGLRRRPDLILVNASGRDHPLGAGLALHLGAVLGLPTIGVTDRPFIATAGRPGPERGAAAPLRVEGRDVGSVLRTRRGARPVVVHAAWRTDPRTAAEVVLGVSDRSRTPEPIRRARLLARVARARDEGRLPPGWSSAAGVPSPGR